jgi:hypothetical protein
VQIFDWYGVGIIVLDNDSPVLGTTLVGVHRPIMNPSRLGVLGYAVQQRHRDLHCNMNGEHWVRKSSVMQSAKARRIWSLSGCMLHWGLPPCTWKRR